LIAERRIGVLLCDCRGQIGSLMDLRAVSDAALSDPRVAFSEVVDSACDLEDKITGTINNVGVDRLIIAGCQNGMVQHAYRSIAERCGLNPYAIQVVNIRDQCGLVHSPQDALEKALLLMAMAIESAHHLRLPVIVRDESFSRAIMVIGNGRGAMTCASEIARGGFPVHLALLAGWDTDDSEVCRLEAQPLITVHRESRLLRLDGYLGRFKARLSSSGSPEWVDCGALILAHDPERAKGDSAKRVCLEEFEGYLIGEAPQNFLFLLDKGASRSSAVRAMEIAAEIKERNHKSTVTVVSPEILAHGRDELRFKYAQELGVIFVRAEGANESHGAYLIFDDVLQEDLLIRPDIVVSSSPLLTENTNEILEALGLPRVEGTLSIPPCTKPSGSSRRGVFICHPGLLLPEEEEGEMKAAANQAITLLSNPLERGGVVAVVDPERCSACLTCMRSCPYHAPYTDEEGKAAIDIPLCLGCGLCVGLCPSQAIDLFCNTSSQLNSLSEMAAKGGRH
jgi:heterodisulfide reductase subunit A